MTPDEDEDWMAGFSLAIADLPDDPDDPTFEDQEPEDLLRAALGGEEQVEQLTEKDRLCFYESAATCVNELVIAYGNNNEGPHRVVFLGDDHNWRAAADTAMSRIRQKVRVSCFNDGIAAPVLPSLYIREFKRLSSTYGSCEMTLTCARPDPGRGLVELFQKRGILPDQKDGAERHE